MFDTIAAKKTINSLQSHRMQPGGELMEKAADLLREALADAGTSMSQIRTAEAEAIGAKKRLEIELLEMKRLRDALTVAEVGIEVLKKVAATKKGASKIAQEWLVSQGLMAAGATEVKG